MKEKSRGISSNTNWRSSEENGSELYQDGLHNFNKIQRGEGVKPAVTRWRKREVVFRYPSWRKEFLLKWIRLITIFIDQGCYSVIRHFLNLPDDIPRIGRPLESSPTFMTLGHNFKCQPIFASRRDHFQALNQPRRCNSGSPTIEIIRVYPLHQITIAYALQQFIPSKSTAESVPFKTSNKSCQAPSHFNKKKWPRAHKNSSAKWNIKLTPR